MIEETKKTNELDELKKQFKEQAQLLDSLQNTQSVFLKNLSQNIRIPLNGIIGMIDVMKMTPISTEQTEYLDIINKYGENLIVIVNDILDYSRIIANELELEQKYFLLSTLLKNLDQSYRMSVEGKGLKFNISVDDKIAAQLFSDEYRIHQILSNLINNAIKFTKEGEITVDIKCIECGNNKSKIRFSVKDTGFGILPAKLSKIKNELQKSTKDSILSTQGIGLGLSISQALLKIMGSELQCTSKQNEGSQFWFQLELKNRNSSLLSPNTFISHGQSLKILLVEDNILNQKFAVATLIKGGHDVTVAENGKIAYEKFLHDPFDLILMDVQMPIMDGVEATENIRKYEQAQEVKQPIKIVAVTAYALDRDRDRCLAAGMDKFLAKPFKPDQLINIINNLDFD